jgi:superoxide dismutase, Fe-Mn family
MKHPIAPLYCRPWTLNGMSPRLIESHYENNYGDALLRLNALTLALESAETTTQSDQQRLRLKRDQTQALNSTLLHELYFASLGGDGRSVPEPIAGALARDFGSVDQWRKEFISLGQALGGESGWVLLTYVPRDGNLVNQATPDHDQGIAGGIPILALDMYEHAYHLEFGANAKAYVAAFMRNIDWFAVQARFEIARQVAAPPRLEQREFVDVPAITVEEVTALLNAGGKPQIIDTRPRHYSTKSQEIMQGAIWRDPERIDEWMGELSKTEPVITFCVYGFHIGCGSAATLRKAGFDARYMAGGHASWKALDGAMKLLD